MSSYSTATYWNQRYKATAEDAPCEWYRDYSSLSPLLHPAHFAIKGTTGLCHHHNRTTTSSVQQQQQALQYFPPRSQCRVLLLGCGNSTLGYDMLQDGWTGGITHLDFSSVVLNQLQQRYHASSFRFCCADMTETLPFDDESFDLIVCKGALDAVLAGGKADVPKLVAEAHRVLQTGHGVLFLVTNGNPDSRLEFLEYKYDLGHYWQGVNVHTVPSSTAASEDANAAGGHGKNEKPVYAYICRKSTGFPRLVKDTAHKENVQTLSGMGQQQQTFSNK